MRHFPSKSRYFKQFSNWPHLDFTIPSKNDSVCFLGHQATQGAGTMNSHKTVTMLEILY